MHESTSVEIIKAKLVVINAEKDAAELKVQGTRENLTELLKLLKHIIANPNELHDGILTCYQVFLN